MMMRHIRTVKKVQGFTLIELMIVVMIIAIFAVIAIPAYGHFIKRATAAEAQQQMQQVAFLLERYKSRNFNYDNFSLEKVKKELGSEAVVTSAHEMTIRPKGKPYYVVLVFAGANGASSTSTLWAMKARSSDSTNYSFLLTSTGVRCKTMLESEIVYQGTDISKVTCGSQSENW